MTINNDGGWKITYPNLTVENLFKNYHLMHKIDVDTNNREDIKTKEEDKDTAEQNLSSYENGGDIIDTAEELERAAKMDEDYRKIQSFLGFDIAESSKFNGKRLSNIDVDRMFVISLCKIASCSGDESGSTSQLNNKEEKSIGRMHASYLKQWQYEIESQGLAWKNLCDGTKNVKLSDIDNLYTCLIRVIVSNMKFAAAKERSQIFTDGVEGRKTNVQGSTEHGYHASCGIMISIDSPINAGNERGDKEMTLGDTIGDNGAAAKSTFESAALNDMKMSDENGDFIAIERPNNGMFKVYFDNDNAIKYVQPVDKNGRTESIICDKDGNPINSSDQSLLPGTFDIYEEIRRINLKKFDLIEAIFFEKASSIVNPNVEIMNANEEVETLNLNTLYHTMFITMKTHATDDDNSIVKIGRNPRAKDSSFRYKLMTNGIYPLMKEDYEKGIYDQKTMENLDKLAFFIEGAAFCDASAMEESMYARNPEGLAVKGKVTKSAVFADDDEGTAVQHHSITGAKYSDWKADRIKPIEQQEGMAPGTYTRGVYPPNRENKNRDDGKNIYKNVKSLGNDDYAFSDSMLDGLAKSYDIVKVFSIKVLLNMIFTAFNSSIKKIEENLNEYGTYGKSGQAEPAKIRVYKDGKSTDEGYSISPGISLRVTDLRYDGDIDNFIFKLCNALFHIEEFYKSFSDISPKKQIGKEDIFSGVITKPYEKEEDEEQTNENGTTKKPRRRKKVESEDPLANVDPNISSELINGLTDNNDEIANLIGNDESGLTNNINNVYFNGGVISDAYDKYLTREGNSLVTLSSIKNLYNRYLQSLIRYGKAKPEKRKTAKGNMWDAATTFCDAALKLCNKLKKNQQLHPDTYETDFADQIAAYKKANAFITKRMLENRVLFNPEQITDAEEYWQTNVQPGKSGRKAQSSNEE